MKQSNKKQIKVAVNMLRRAHGKMCELMDKEIVPEYSLDICAIDEIVRVLEGFENK